MVNAYLHENLAPVREETTLTQLEVTGTIPPHLDGRYLRNGPNPASEIDEDTYHWFMGDGMVHGIRLRDGRAEWYRNRWVRTPELAHRFGETLSSTRRSAPIEFVGANTNVISHAGRTLALIEGGTACHELTDELDTVGPCDFDGTITGGYTAHPKLDPQTGELHAISYFFARPNSAQYSVIGVDGRARRVVDIPVSGGPMMHDFSLTEKYVVLYDLPVTFDVKQAVAATVPKFAQAPARLTMSALLGRVHVPDPVAASLGRKTPANGVMPYRWNPQHPARVGVMPREGDGSQVRWFDVDPCYVFHPLNAYDDGETIVLDLVRHPKMFDTDLRGPGEGAPSLERWVVDLDSGKVLQSRLDDRPQEFPRIDERLTGRRHRFGYTMDLAQHVRPSDAVLKHDLVSGTTQAHHFGAGKQSSEFVFVPNAADSPEDDGVLMGFVFDPSIQRSELAILDAATMESIASVHLPVRVPAGFHGNWAPTP
ncbi:carotenoid cleavage dioxygenase [Frankineae bacterium MT45]|nr:carotenoid cleavage dioxygenase [Frankineae bacterium MT45]